MLMQESKKCIKCGDVKPLGEYGKAKTNKDGYKGTCRKCCNANSRAYSAANPEKKKANALKHYYKERDHYRNYSKEYQKAHPEKGREKAARFRVGKKELMCQKAAEYLAANKTEVYARDKKRRDELHPTYVKTIIWLKYKLRSDVVTGQLIDNERKLLKAKRTIKLIENGKQN